jgi:hypothetical protein
VAWRAALKRTWPLPALLVWAAGWAAFVALRALGVPLPAAVVTVSLAGALAGSVFEGGWQRLFVVLGFPLSIGVSGAAAAMPAWLWLAPLALLAVLYPMHAWRDAPLFPTPRGALAGLALRVPLTPAARVLDAGCGVGDGLQELRREYPGAALEGIEWSWPLRLVCAWRCRFATVRRGDIWRADWSRFDVVYLFQRPESMARAVDKAGRELRTGAWLASLEFEATTLAPNAVLEGADGRRVWLYRVPFTAEPLR